MYLAIFHVVRVYHCGVKIWRMIPRCIVVTLRIGCSMTVFRANAFAATQRHIRTPFQILAVKALTAQK